jgi:hypothetical protein
VSRAQALAETQQIALEIWPFERRSAPDGIGCCARWRPKACCSPERAALSA